jgi:hypothetical protein
MLTLLLANCRRRSSSSSLRSTPPIRWAAPRRPRKRWPATAGRRLPVKRRHRGAGAERPQRQPGGALPWRPAREEADPDHRPSGRGRSARADWTTDPFQFVEKDGYFYGRGTQDMKVSDAILVTTFIRFRREGYRPDRDLILALTADEEGGKSNGVDLAAEESSRSDRRRIRAEYGFGAASPPSVASPSTSMSRPARSSMPISS